MSYYPSETDDKLLRVEPTFVAWLSDDCKSDKSFGNVNGGDIGPYSCSCSSNCCANVSSSFYLFEEKKKN